MEDTTLASGVLNAAASRFPSDGLIRLGAADIFAANGNDSRAAGIMVQASILAKSSTNPVEMVTVLGRICGFDVVTFQYQQAMGACQQAAQQAGATGEDASGAFDNLAAAQAGLGQLVPAIADLSSAIGAFQGNVSPDAQPAGVDGFGLAYLYEAAWTAVRREPRDPECHHGLPAGRGLAALRAARLRGPAPKRHHLLLGTTRPSLSSGESVASRPGFRIDIGRPGEGRLLRPRCQGRRP